MPTSVSFTLPARLASPQALRRVRERAPDRDTRFSRCARASACGGRGRSAMEVLGRRRLRLSTGRRVARPSSTRSACSRTRSRSMALPERGSLRLHLVRPDDLLNLEIEAVNLRVDRRGREPALVVADPDQPARLIVLFPPQTIAESAFFEYSVVAPDLTTETPIDPAPTNPDVEKSESDNDPLPSRSQGHSPPIRHVTASPGSPTRAALSSTCPATHGPAHDRWASRLVRARPRREPARRDPPRAERRADRGCARHSSAGGESETALELPYRLVVSPLLESTGGVVSWAHRTQPFASRGGRRALAHPPRLRASTMRTRRRRSSSHVGARAPLRAIWSPDYAPFNRPPPEKPDPNLGLTAMSPNDRHQIVILTSAFRGYEYEVELDLLASVRSVRGDGRARSRRGRGSRSG